MGPGFNADSAINAAQRRGRRATTVAISLAIFLVTIAAAFVQYDHLLRTRSSQSQVALYARVLEDQISRVFRNLDITAHSISDLIFSSKEVLAGPAIAETLIVRTAAQPYLQSVSLVAADGRILSSSYVADKGGQIPADLLSAIRTDTVSLQLLAPRSGRGLAGPSLAAATVRTPSILPVARSISRSDGSIVLLIASVNLDFFATQFERVVSDRSIRTVLAAYSGELLLATGEGSIRSDDKSVANAIFAERLAKKDHDIYAGPGVTEPAVIGAYRASRDWPLVVIAEESQDSLNLHWRRDVYRVTAGVLALLSLLSICTVMIRNSARRDEALTLELQKSYTELLAVESRKESILKASLDAVISTDADGLIMDLNPAASRIFGFRIDEVLGASLENLIFSPDIHASSHFDLRGLLANANDKALNQLRQLEAVRRDGSRLPVEFTVARVPSTAQMFYTVTIRDISARVDSERALRESEQRWKLALEAAGDGVWDWNIATDQMVYSNHLLRMLGYEVHDLSTERQAWSALVHHSDQASVARAIAGHLKGQTPAFAVEGRMRCKDGSWRWIQARGMVVERCRESGAPIRLVGTGTDVSARKSAEQERASLLAKSDELAKQLQRARDTEIDVGARIQRSLLLTAQSRPVADLWVTCYNQASQGVDGDFVEITCPNDHVIDIVVGDVMGKGVNAALMSAAVKMQLSRSMVELMTDAAKTANLPPPADIVQSLHLAVTPHLQALDSFVTLCYARIDTRANTLTWVGCGHEAPVLLRKGFAPLTLGNQHPPIGVLEVAVFEQETIGMYGHDALFFHSDGVTDAVCADGRQLGHKELYATLCRHLATHETPAAVLHTMRRAMFGEGVRITDDLTMVLATRAINGSMAKRVEVDCELKSIQRVRALVNQVSQNAGMAQDQAALFTVAAVEVFTNIVRHSKGRLAGAPVEIVISKISENVQLDMIYLADFFQPPKDRELPDLDDFPEGGFGLGIIREVCDQVDYGHRDGVNTIRMIKAVRNLETALVEA